MVWVVVGSIEFSLIFLFGVYFFGLMLLSFVCFVGLNWV